ncbi:DUF302 domain-containing protein [Yangia mangrovi]|uniref:DUF302 domain-containing protein n=1 Tax=Alloyangia mangrovi TaxID=1779329 RepID=A0A2A3JS01_9RHOB|nr:DUF302 domain-containing protein [Alloyangia mangrovi]MCA0939777.1 DUF302 domain-containing protein [Alloyangia pacifica]MCA0944917.1 DUF302 domain-containing protein [Alloyangia pacifica]MCT4370636.1 DUF302 domain-containing protein [Alloyangia mangrovi]
MLKTLALLITLPAAAMAQEVITHPYDGSFDEATFALENAIIGEGLVVDHVSHVGEMLARTGADIGADTHLFDAADVYLFCSATTSREVMEADPENVAFCPYAIFVESRDGQTTLGYRSFARESMAPVNDLLARIAAAATEF